MSAERASARPAVPRRSGPVGHRQSLCIWLGCLSSWRQGLVKRLVRDYGSVAKVLDRPVGELAARVSKNGTATAEKPRAASRGGPPASIRVAHDVESRGEEAQFEEVLEAGPAGCLALLERKSGHDSVLAWCDPLYPPSLRQLADPPLCLFVRGGRSADDTARRLSALAARSAVAVVGTRSPSPYGVEMAALLGRDLVRAGIVVVSGLALGIDATAQAAAIEAARDDDAVPTVAVLGCGTDIAYPRAHAGLHATIAGRGLVVSEFAWGVQARGWRFPARNRVMAALSRAVVVVEGAERSGARITAEFALDLGREVLCVPGEAGRRLSAAPRGGHSEGAAVCEGAPDVLRAIASEPLTPTESASARGADAGTEWEARLLNHGEAVHRDVLHALAEASLNVGELARRCGVGAPMIAAAVGELEVEGLVRRVEGGLYRLRRS